MDITIGDCRFNIHLLVKKRKMNICTNSGMGETGTRFFSWHHNGATPSHAILMEIQNRIGQVIY